MLAALIFRAVEAAASPLVQVRPTHGGTMEVPRDLLLFPYTYMYRYSCIGTRRLRGR